MTDSMGEGVQERMEEGVEEGDTLLDSISEFCRQAGMAESTFGRRAVNDGKFVSRLRAGARVTQDTFDRIRDFMAQVPPPWVLKPRSEASSMGIKKINHPDELWATLNTLGDRQSYYVLERFVAGDVYHVDSVVWDREVHYAVANKYGMPPMTVARRS